MAERRSLIEGLETEEPPVDPVKAREFVFGKTIPPHEPVSSVVHTSSPISTRIRTDLALALKRASLDRQLKGQEPNTVRDILEQAIEPWLKTNGYLS